MSIVGGFALLAQAVADADNTQFGGTVNQLEDTLIYTRPSEGFDFSCKNIGVNQPVWDPMLLSPTVFSTVDNLPSPFSDQDTYWNYATVIGNLKAFAAANPTNVIYQNLAGIPGGHVISNSLEQPSLTLFDDGVRPVIQIQNVVHGPEKHSLRGSYAFFEQLISSSHPMMVWARENLCFRWVATQNPNGYVNNNRSNANGVNLNRNGAFGWASASDPDKGSAPYSEFESQNLRNFGIANTAMMRRTILGLDVHQWNSPSAVSGTPNIPYGFLTDSQSTNQSVQEAHRCVYQWANTLLAQRDWSNLTILSTLGAANQYLWERDSKLKPYPMPYDLHRYINKDADPLRTLPDGFALQVEMPMGSSANGGAMSTPPTLGWDQTIHGESQAVNGTFQLDLLSALVMTARTMLAPSQKGYHLAPSCSPSDIQNLGYSFFAQPHWNITEDRPGGFAIKGTTLTVDYSSNPQDGEVNVLMQRSIESAWPSTFARAAGVLVNTGDTRTSYFLEMGGISKSSGYMEFIQDQIPAPPGSSSTSVYRPVNPNPSFPSLPVNLYDLSLAYDTNYIYAIGGYTGTAYSNVVYRLARIQGFSYGQVYTKIPNPIGATTVRVACGSGGSVSYHAGDTLLFSGSSTPATVATSITINAGSYGDVVLTSGITVAQSGGEVVTLLPYVGTWSQWSTLTTYSQGLQRHTSHVYNGGLFIIGGRDSVDYTPNILRKDLTSGVETVFASLPAKTGWHTSELIGSDLYVAGGWGGSLAKSTFTKINLGTAAVTPMPVIPSTIRQTRLVYDGSGNGNLWLLTGRRSSDSDYTDSIYQFDISSNSWTTFSSSSGWGWDSSSYDEEVTAVTPTFFFDGAQAYYNSVSGNIVIIGGEDSTGTAQGEVYEFDPDTNTMYARAASSALYGQIGKSVHFNVNPGTQLSMVACVSNASDSADMTISPYFRPIWDIGALTTSYRQAAHVAMIPQRSPYVYSFHADVETRTFSSSQEIRSYLRHYGSGTQIGLNCYQITTIPYLAVPVDETNGVAEGILTSNFQAPISPGISNWHSYAVLPKWGSQLLANLTIAEGILDTNYDLTDFQIKWVSNPTISQSSVPAWQPGVVTSGALEISYSVKGSPQPVVILAQGLEINHDTSSSSKTGASMPKRDSFAIRLRWDSGLRIQLWFYGRLFDVTIPINNCRIKGLRWRGVGNTVTAFKEVKDWVPIPAGPVTPPPVIVKFIADTTPIPSGTSTTLTGTFTGGTGTIDQGIADVNTDSPVSTGILTSDTTYTLTVTNPLGASVTATKTVVVEPYVWQIYATLPEMFWTPCWAQLTPDSIMAIGGGWGGGVLSNRCYILKNGAWTRTGDLNVPRYGAYNTHSAQCATLLDGRVLVCGMAELSNGNSSPNQKSAEIYDPSTGLWTPTGDMIHGRATDCYPVTLSDGRVMVYGGASADAKLYNTCEIYDPATGTWSEQPGADVPYYYYLKIDTTGGHYTYYGPFIMEQPTSSWTGQISAPITLHDGRVLWARPNAGMVYEYNDITYGHVTTFPQTLSHKIVIYDPSTGTWESKATHWEAPLLYNWINLLNVVEGPDGNVYFLGMKTSQVGNNGYTTCFRWVTSTDTFEVLPDPPHTMVSCYTYGVVANRYIFVQGMVDYTTGQTRYGSILFDTVDLTWKMFAPNAQNVGSARIAGQQNGYGHGSIDGRPVCWGSTGNQTFPYTKTEMFYGTLTL